MVFLVVVLVVGKGICMKLLLFKVLYKVGGVFMV